MNDRLTVRLVKARKSAVMSTGDQHNDVSARFVSRGMAALQSWYCKADEEFLQRRRAYANEPRALS